MLQRNDTGSPLVMPTLDPPIEVPPDAVIDHHELLAGFTPIDEPAHDRPAPAGDKPAPTKPATTDASGEEATK